jgi:hypothetical protein
MQLLGDSAQMSWRRWLARGFLFGFAAAAGAWLAIALLAALVRPL